MLYILEKLGVNLICPLLCIAVEIYVRKRNKRNTKAISLKWFAFWVIGVGALITGLMQSLNPAFTAGLLKLQSNDFIIVRELGVAQIGMGILGLLTVKNLNYRKPAAIVYGIFIFGCTLIHFTRISIISSGEIAALVTDVWIVVVSAAQVIINCKE